MYLENRYIAVLDVLGLANQIRDKNGLLRTMATYNAAVEETREHILITRSTLSSEHDAHHAEAVEFVFDTLVLVSYPRANRGCAGSFIGCIAALMAHFARHSLPLRGAIGIGDYLVEEKSSRLFLSSVFKSLNEAIGCQDWSGCILLPSFETELLADIFGDFQPPSGRSAGLYRYPVPMKSGPCECWCLNWLDTMESADIESLLQYMRGDDSKRANTASFVQFYRGLPSDEIALPEEFAPAKLAKIVHAGQSVFRLSFWDTARRGCRPACRDWVFDPRHASSLGNGFIGFNDDTELAARQKERWGTEQPKAPKPR